MNESEAVLDLIAQNQLIFVVLGVVILLLGVIRHLILRNTSDYQYMPTGLIISFGVGVAILPTAMSGISKIIGS